MSATILPENNLHYPVLLKEVLSIISPQNGGTFIDCTFGQGGYTKKILEFDKTKVIALDRDPESEKIALVALVNSLENCDDTMKPEDIQTTIYTVGKENGYRENLRDWFKLIYEVVFGVENGPRFGFFISFFGVQETKELIKSKLENV